MDRRHSLLNPSLIAIPLAVAGVVVAVAFAVLHAARIDADVANARMLLVVANLSSVDVSPGAEEPADLARYLPHMPVPSAYGAERRFAVYRRDGSFTVYALESETTGWRYDPATATFGGPEPLADAGEVVAS